MSDRLVELVGGYTIADNVPAKGTVSVNPLVLAGNSAPEKRLVTKHTVVGTLDSDGRFSVEVLDSFDPDWNVEGGVPYEVREYIIGGRGRSYVVYITGPGPVDLFDLQPVEVDGQTVAPFPVKGDPGPKGDPGVGIRILSAVPTVADLPALGEDGDAHLVIESGDLYVWGTDGAWHDSGHVQGPPGPPGAAGTLNDLTDVDTTRDATGMVVTRQSDGTYKGQHVRIGLNQLTDVTAPAATPPNSLLGTVGEGATPGQAEWEPLHLDYVQQVVLGPLPSSVADLSQRVTELEHTGEVVPPDLELTVDLYSGSFTRIMGCDPITASPSQRIRLSLATTPGPNGAVFADLSGISGTGAVWADFAGNIGKVVDTSGTAINGAALKEAIRRGQIVTVHRGAEGSHPTLVAEKVENPADTGSSLTLDALKDVTAPANTPAGKFIGTTAVGEWGPVDGLPPIPAPAPYTYSQAGVQSAGQTVILQGYFAVHETDTQGVDHDWGTVLQAGDKVTWHGQTYTVALVNLSDGTLPQMLIDTFVASGICMVKPVEAVPAAPSNGSAVLFGPAWDGKVLGVEGGAWGPVDVLPLTGGTLTGGLTVPDIGANTVSVYVAPTADHHAATKKYVDDGLAALEARIAALETP
jgi:hypothetical protein